MPASNHTLGVTVSLPEGTASEMERRRAEELRRRQREQGPEQPQGAAPPRRLAPQRKKKVPVPAAAEVEGSSCGGPVSGERLPLNISGDGAGGDGAEAILFDEHEEEGGLTRRVADWTLREAKETAAAPTAANGASDEEESDAQEEGEYHGEIESVASDDGKNESASATSETDKEETEDIFHITTEDDISLDPPSPTSPLVLVNLASLCGCRPEDYHEKQLMERQLLRAVMGPRDREDDTDETNEGTEEEAWEGLDFDERAVELFESGAGRHADTSHPLVVAVAAEGPDNDESDAVSPYAALSYPEFLTERDSTTPRSTARMWKVLHTNPTTDPQLSPLLSRIFAHLRGTSRSLLWKADMHHELSQLARREHHLKKRRTQQKEYNEWKESTRGQRLERLYDVRETFQVQVDAAKKKYEAFVLEREERVERELQRRGLVGLRGGAHKNNNVLGGFPRLDAEDAGEREEEQYDEDGWGGTVQEDDIIGEERDGETHRFDLPYEDDENGETDEWSPLHANADPLGMDLVLEGVPGTAVSSPPDRDVPPEAQPPAPHRLEPISHDDNLHRISKRQQQKKQQQTPAAPSQRDDHLRSQEEAIRDMLKTNDERIAHATWLTLERRLKGVDELLEKLQEEEWAEEEDEEEEGGTMGRSGMADADAADESGTNLLDQILAMILGMLPKEEDGTTDEEHYRYVKGEHDAIVKQWMAAFGRLPPFPAAEAATEPETEERGDALPFGDGFVPSGTRLGPGRAGEGGDDLVEMKKKALRLVGNEDGNWDDVEDWDAVFPGV